MRYRDIVLADRPNGLWMLDEASGAVARDAAGYAGNATIAGSPVMRVRGPSGAIPYAMAFDGSNDKVTLPSSRITNPASGSQQTWEAWANSPVDATSSAGAKYLFGAEDSVFQAAAIGSDATGRFAGEVSCIANDRGGSSDGTGWTGATIPAGWHYHVWQYNGNQGGWRYYLDGHEWIGVVPGVSTLSSSGGAFGLISLGGATSWTIGAAFTSFSSWTGIAAFALYNRSLTHAEVQRHYAAGRAGGRPSRRLAA